MHGLPDAAGPAVRAGERRRPGAGARRLGLRPLVDKVVAASARPLDRAFDEVFERGLEVRSADHAEELLGAVSARESASTRIGAWVALAASLRPLVLRMVRRASKARRLAKFTGAGRMAAWGVTGAVAAGRVVEAARHGVGELQIIAAFLATRVVDRGHRPARHAVEAAALALYVKPSKQPDLSQPRPAALKAVARRWVLDALRPDAEDARRRRTRARLRAVAGLPAAELLRLVDVIPATTRPDAPMPAGEEPPPRGRAHA